METFKIVFEVQAESLNEARAFALEIVSKTGISPKHIIDKHDIPYPFKKQFAIRSIKK